MSGAAPRASRKGVVHLLQEFSVPLLAGVAAALLFANLDFEAYHRLIETPLLPWRVFGYPISLHWLVNDVFMVFFFGVAAKEITEAALPGGSLNPLRKAVNPLLATIGGVVGPIATFFVGLYLVDRAGLLPEGASAGDLRRGWGIPTATDIALAWLVARTVFGAGHPMIDFLLLLAVADDAIGLVIIAIFYGDPEHPARPAFLLLVLLGMAIAYLLRRRRVKAWPAYVFLAGPPAWCGLLLAHLHPALALVFVVPFLPGPERDTGLFVDEESPDAGPGAHEPSPLHAFEHQLKGFVDFGLFFFALTNAGVRFAGIGALTWLILGALVVGKTAGITLCSWLGQRIGFPLPSGVRFTELVMAAFIAALGLTVALFVAGAAFVDPDLQGQAKMGALFSGLVGVAAIVLGRLLGFGPRRRRGPSG